MKPHLLTIGRAFLRAGFGLAVLLLHAPQAPGQAAWESLERPDGRKVEGRLEGAARSGFRFVPRDGSTPVALEPGCVVHQGGPGPDLLASPPPFHVLVGEAARLSGSLRALTGATVRLGVGWQSDEVTLPRPCVQAIVQQPGEARVLVEGFEVLDPARWSIQGKADLV